MKKSTERLLIGAAVVGLLSAGGAFTKDAQAAKAPMMGKCMGANTCKAGANCKADPAKCGGKGGCAVAASKDNPGNSCKGQAMKGKGWVEMSKADCAGKGTWVPMKAMGKMKKKMSS